MGPKESDETERRAVERYRLAQVESALKRGANTFAKLRALIIASALGSMGAGAGMVWTVAQRARDADYTAKDVEILLKKQEEARQRDTDFNERLIGIEAALRQERERRELLERALQERRPARRGRP